MTFIQNNPLSRRKSSPCNQNDEETLTETRKKPGGSNAGKYPNVPKDEFCGPAGGAPAGTFPVNTPERISAAIMESGHAPHPAGIKSCAEDARKKHGEGVARRSSSPLNNSGLPGIDESAEIRIDPYTNIEEGKGRGDYGTQALESQNKGLSREGSMTGDQSATHTDYSDFKDTDPHYHGHEGESHGDQSATRTDYMGNMGRHHIDSRTKK